MYKNRLSHLLLISVLLPMNISARAAEISEGVSRQCEQQIEATEQKLLEITNLNLVKSGTEKYAASEPKRPVYATYSIYFITNKRGGSNLMNSPRLMRSISTELFANCDAAGSVTFGFNKSNRSEIFGKMTNGTILKFECAKDLDKITWGTQACL